MPAEYLPQPSAPPTVFQPNGPPQVKKIPECRYPAPEAKQPFLRPEVKRAAPPPRPAATPTPKPSPERPAHKEKAAGEAPKERIPHTKAEPKEPRPETAKAAPKASPDAATATAGDTPNFIIAAPTGTVVRITGLKATPQLNGELGQVLRIKEDQPDRTIIRTSFGEKALKEANIQVGLIAVCPRGAVPLMIALAILTIMGAVDVCLGFNGMQIGVVTAPVLALFWLLGTLALCSWLYRPCRPEGTWVPAMSDLGSAAPARHIFRVGFLLVAILLASSTWLYGEILLARLGDVPDPPEPVAELEPIPPGAEPQAEDAEDLEPAEPAAAVEPALVVEDTSAKGCSSFSTSETCPSHCFWTAGWLRSSCEAGQACSAFSTSETCPSICTWRAGWLSSSCEVMEGCSTFATWETCPSYCKWNAGWLSSSCEAVVNATENANLTASKNRTERVVGPPPEWMIRRSLMYGYAAAAAAGVQGLFGLQERLLSPQSVIHIAGAVVFAVSAMQHCQQSTLLLSSVRGEPLRTASDWVVTIVKFRRQIGDFAPIVLLALPLASQMFNRDNSAGSRRPTMQSALQSSGLLTSAKAMQWGSLLLYTVFVSTYALDFWVCGGIPPGDEEPDA